MALADYMIDDGDGELYPDAEAFLDDLAANGGLPGRETSGRSDEYIGFEGDKSGNGYEVDWYLFLRTDDLDSYSHFDDPQFSTTFDFTLTVNFDGMRLSPENLDYFDKVEGFRSNTISYPYLAGWIVDGSFDERRPDDLAEIEGVVYDMSGGGSHSGSIDDKWDVKYVAFAIKSDLKDCLSEIAFIASEIREVVNTWQDGWIGQGVDENRDRTPKKSARRAKPIKSRYNIGDEVAGDDLTEDDGYYYAQGGSEAEDLAREALGLEDIHGYSDDEILDATNAIVKMGNAEYDEVWLTWDSRWFEVGTPYELVFTQDALHEWIRRDK